MSAITTDYTKAGNEDTMQHGGLSAYRLMHWLCNILQNFFADPINIRDERLKSLLWRQDKKDETKLYAKFDIGTAYAQNTIKANTTPMIVVFVGDTVHDNSVVNQGVSSVIALNGARPMYQGRCTKIIPLNISITTESYDGTMLLAGLIEDFLTVNELQLIEDCRMINIFKVVSVTAPKKTEDQNTAKETYQSFIQIQTSGCISWTTDTQGPVFRGIRSSVGIAQ